MPWSNAAITNAGIALQNKTVSGGTISLTAAKAGSGSVPVVDLRNQTELQSIKQTMQIHKLRINENTVTVELLLETIGLTESYNLQQIGLYATDPDDGEILFAIAQADAAQQIPTEEEMPLYSILFSVSLVMANSQTITATIDPTVLVTQSELQEAMAGIDMSSKADKDNPIMTGPLSVNRKEGSEVGSYSVSIGMANEASGIGSTGEGIGTAATGIGAHSAGYYTIAKQMQMAVGLFNEDQRCPSVDLQKGSGTVFVIGNGNTQTKSNVLRVTYEGTCYGKAAFAASGADYAEYFEWEDGNPDAEDRRGYFVTIHGNKIAIANPGDFIAGIVSGNPSVIGNADECWRGKYLYDEFGGPVMVDQEAKIPDPETGELYTAIIHTHAVNPEYEPERQYLHRKERKEWDAVCMVGVIRVRDDNTCLIDGFCKVSENGIATRADSGYRVLNRISEFVIEILFSTYAHV